MSALAQLTEAHRLAQLRLGTTTIEQLLRIWPLLDPTDLDGTTEQWLRVAIPIVQTQRSASSALAASYVTTFRALTVGPDGEYLPVLAGPANAQALLTSLTVTGPVRLRQLTGRAIPIGRAAELASVTAARSGMRHVLDGGRDTVQQSIAADRRALGWSRVTSGAPCAFCAMLAGRGPDYRSEDSAGFAAHDGCSCSAEPVYSADQEWPAGAGQYRQLWDDSTAGLSGNEAINAFRQAFTAA